MSAVMYDSPWLTSLPYRGFAKQRLRKALEQGEKDTIMGGRSTLENQMRIDTVLCREEVERILASETFGKAPRLCLFLNYVCENSLLGRFDDLTEQQIGIHVFQRSPGFNSGEDTIVRGTARHLRTRLDLYYREEGKHDPVCISIPKGGYIARFNPVTETVHENLSTISEESTSDVSAFHAPPPNLPPEDAEASHGRWPVTAKVSLACALLAATLLAALAMHLVHSPTADSTAVGPTALWRALFTEGRRTLIVPGDASLDAYIAWEQQAVSLDQYANQTYQREVTVSRPPSTNDVPLSVRSVTPMADLRLVAELVRVPEHLGMPQTEKWMEVRYARDLAIADTHENNLILIGSESFNPWVTLYQPLLDFKVGWDFRTDIYSVTDRAPKPGQLARYEYRRDAPGSKAMTLVAFVNNSQGHGHVLLIEGSSMGTTYSALNFFTNEHLWKPVIDAATAPDGALHSFEVLLSSDFVRGGVSNTKVLATHVH